MDKFTAWMVFVALFGLAWMAFLAWAIATVVGKL